MTNNTEKLYELAEVPRIYSEFNNGRETIVENVFSPYRQLELIKWLAKLGEFEFCLEIAHNSFDVFTFYFNGIRVHAHFEQALAGLVCELWEDLTDEQREEIKRILE